MVKGRWAPDRRYHNDQRQPHHELHFRDARRDPTWLGKTKARHGGCHCYLSFSRPAPPRPDRTPLPQTRFWGGGRGMVREVSAGTGEGGALGTCGGPGWVASDAWTSWHFGSSCYVFNSFGFIGRFFMPRTVLANDSNARHRNEWIRDPVTDQPLTCEVVLRSREFCGAPAVRLCARCSKRVCKTFAHQAFAFHGSSRVDAGIVCKTCSDALSARI